MVMMTLDNVIICLKYQCSDHINLYTQSREPPLMCAILKNRPVHLGLSYIFLLLVNLLKYTLYFSNIYKMSHRP